MTAQKKQTGPSEAILVRLPDELLQPLDALRRAETHPPTRPEMIRRILQAWIKENATRE